MKNTGSAVSMSYNQYHIFSKKHAARLLKEAESDIAQAERALPKTRSYAGFKNLQDQTKQAVEWLRDMETHCWDWSQASRFTFELLNSRAKLLSRIVGARERELYRESVGLKHLVGPKSVRVSGWDIRFFVEVKWEGKKLARLTELEMAYVSSDCRIGEVLLRFEPVGWNPTDRQLVTHADLGQEIAGQLGGVFKQEVRLHVDDAKLIEKLSIRALVQEGFLEAWAIV